MFLKKFFLIEKIDKKYMSKIYLIWSRATSCYKRYFMTHFLTKKKKIFKNRSDSFNLEDSSSLMTLYLLYLLILIDIIFIFKHIFLKTIYLRQKKSPDRT